MRSGAVHQSVMEIETINHATLKKLTEADVVRAARVDAVPGGWSIVVKYGMVGRVDGRIPAKTWLAAL